MNRSPELLLSKHTDVLYDVGSAMHNGKRLALRFDAKGNSTYEEVSRVDVLKLVQTAAATVKPLVPSRLQGRVDIPKIHMRDLRKLDNVFAVSNEPSLVVRQQAILINADPIRAVIVRECCLVFLPDGADSLVSLLKGCFTEQVVYSQSIAFEFAALEAVLQTICKVLSNDCEKVLPVAKMSVDRMARDDLPMGD
ncbi:CorA Metal Ion Transporter (MIT) Family, partial [Achlya hypogyna]